MWLASVLTNEAVAMLRMLDSQEVPKAISAKENLNDGIELCLPGIPPPKQPIWPAQGETLEKERSVGLSEAERLGASL